MQYGHFDDKRYEYVIERPDTPKSWSNSLGSTEYGAIITNNAGGYSFYRSAALGRLTRFRTNTIPMDQPGRYFYIRDNEDGDYWSATWQPVGKSLKKYRGTCRHGMGYTIIESQYSGIRSESTYFVPLGRNFECWILKLTNKSKSPRKLSAFSYVELVNNWTMGQDIVNIQYTQYIVKMSMVDGIIRHATNDNVPEDPEHFLNNDQGRHVFLGLVGATAAGFDTDRDVFIGPYRSYHNPLIVEQGKCTGSLAHGDNGCGTFQVDVDLAPGESRELMVIMGVGKAEREGKAVLAEFDTVEKAHTALEQVKSHWRGRLGRYIVKSPDHELDSMLNVWNAYNCLITYAWSRAASLIYSGERDGLAYRDTVQDLLGALPTIPEDAGKRLELMITGQYSNGGAMQVVRPFAHRPGTEKLPGLERFRSDDCQWLFNAVPAYVKETGDIAFYDKMLPFADTGEATVLGHLRRAIQFNLDNVGDHGLPCGLEADWNDCIKFGPKGESVFVTFQVRFGLSTYIEIARMLGREAEVTWATAELAKLDENIRRIAWDGQWFIRGTRADGSIIGTKNDPEGSIFLNTQSWAVISGFASPDQAATAMEQVKQRLATEYGLLICDPPFQKTDYHVVRAVLFNTGQKENGGIFSQPQTWAVIAEAMLGHGDRAYEYYRAYMPSAYNTRAELRQIEPYVHCQSTHGRESGRFGASRLPWLTGTASWSYVAGTQYVLGIRPDYNGLRIDPCIPARWDGFKVQRIFRGATYEITVKNPSHVCGGVKRMKVNGKTIDGNLVPAHGAGEVVKVVVELQG